MGTVTYNGTTILDSAHLTQFVKHETVSERLLTSLQLARGDGEVLIADRRGKKMVTLKGYLNASSRANLDAAIDTFTSLLSASQGTLLVDWNGTTRQYVATCTKHEFDRDFFNISAVPWTAEFTVLSGEGFDPSTTTPLSAHSLTTTADAYVSDSFTMSGSKPARPLITLTGNTFNSVNRGIEYMNVDTGERLVVTRADGGSFSANTVHALIDCNARTVSTNFSNSGSTVPVKFYGVFPTFKIGTNNVQVKVGGLVCVDYYTNVIVAGAPEITATNYYDAQSFTVPYTDGTFQGLLLDLSWSGSPGTLTVKIESDNNGNPSGTAIATLTTTIGAYTGAALYFSSPFSLNANTRYWIVISAASVDSSNYWLWWYNNQSGYPNGLMNDSGDGGSTWSTTANQNHLFQILYGGAPGTSTVLHTVTYTKTYL